MDNSEIKNQIYRGGAPVGYLSELKQLEQNSILFFLYLRNLIYIELNWLLFGHFI